MLMLNSGGYHHHYVKDQGLKVANETQTFQFSPQEDGLPAGNQD